MLAINRPTPMQSMSTTHRMNLNRLNGLKLMHMPNINELTREKMNTIRHLKFIPDTNLLKQFINSYFTKDQ